MNKEELIKQLRVSDSEQVPKVKRLIDLANKALKTHEVVVSDFLSPDIHAYVASIMFHYPDLNYVLDGGYEEFEYGCLVIYPDYLVDVEGVVSILDMTYNIKYGEISHRDVLGAILGLGIKREVVGDILLEPGHVQMMVSPDIIGYLEANISKIGRVTVEAKSVGKDALIHKEQTFKWVDSTVKSLRLDAIISSGYNISRSKAVELIKAERVKLNHNFTTQTSKEVEAGMLISVKGKGRMLLEEVNGLTKKERYKIKIKKYV